MDLVEEDILMHYGVKRRSGRYPWGSGDNPYQHGGDFLARVEELQRLGKTEKQIADELHLSTTDLRMQVRVAKHERRALQADRARSLREDGKTLDEIASILGYANDSSVRALLNENTAVNKNKAQATAEILKKELAEKGAIDVGTGVERQLGVSTGVLQEALFILETEGYNRYGVGVPQVNDPKKRTITPVISVPEIDQREVYQNLDLVKSVGDYHSSDGGESWDKREYPASIDSSRVKILYGDEGGALKDGVIEIRRGVADLDLGDSHYAQVRILVDGTHYLKGMAMYSDDMPDGADIVFNTNKHTGTPKMDVLKKIQDDPDNPFGALIKANGQSHYIDADGNEKLSAINKLKEEGDWDKMSKNLSSQFLSKQPIQLIKKQLDLTYADAADEFSEICSLNNPTVKRKLLLDFADECDSAAVHLKAAALPRQSTQVILPLNAMKETEIFAPNYRDGEKVVLIRYPHGGTFEIPELTVNNKNPTAVSVLGKNIRDAVGINPKVAERLSGADFDGDQVVVIPTGGRVKIQSTPALKDLKDFDPKTDYSTEGKTGVRLLAKGAATQRQMGEISNLITDMTLKGATEPEIARAVKHSMVVIDAAKHRLCDAIMEYGVLIGAFFSAWFLHLTLQPLDLMIHQKQYGVSHYLRQMDNFTIFGSNKRKLRKLLEDIKKWLAEIGMKIKGNWQIFRVGFTPKVERAHQALPKKKQRHRRPRLPSALGYRFGHGYTILRKHNLFRLKQSLHLYYYRQDRNRVISFKRASGLISRLGQLRKCNHQQVLDRHYQPKTMFALKKVVRKECRRLQALYPPYQAA